MENIYYDKEGQPMDMFEWGRKFENREYKIIAQDTLSNNHFVSTVWLGMDHNWGEGPPLIFETMVFPHEGEWAESDCERYATLKEAKKGHRRMVKKWSKIN